MNQQEQHEETMRNWAKVERNLGFAIKVMWVVVALKSVLIGLLLWQEFAQ